MKSGSVQVVKNLRPPTVEGLHHRILCLTGENKGTSYYIKSNRIVLGRSDNVDVKVMDTKSSKLHAEIVRVGNNYVLTDLKSQNGTMVNDLKVTQHTLKDGDKIIIGQTVYKYNAIKVDTPKIIKEEKDIEEDDEEDDEKKENTNKRPLLFLVVAVFVLFIVFGSGDEEVKKKKADEKKFQNVTDEFTAMLQKKKEEENKEIQAKIEEIIHRGLREMREGNYFRAMAEFNLALVMNPNNGRASFYMNKTKQALEKEIESNMIKARRDQEALKYVSAIQSYCNILRLLEGYEEDDRFKKATDEVKEVEKKMGLDEGEIKCTEIEKGKQ